MQQEFRIDGWLWGRGGGGELERKETRPVKEVNTKAAMGEWLRPDGVIVTWGYLSGMKFTIFIFCSGATDFRLQSTYREMRGWPAQT